MMKSQQIKLLPKATSDAVRSGQVIGSVNRAIEELVRNSVLHGNAKTVHVTIGECFYNTENATERAIARNLFYIEVDDDGIGIEKEALMHWIGTHECSSSCANLNDSSNDTSNPYANQKDQDFKGETLKALACLCVEMNITTSTVPRSQVHASRYIPHGRTISMQKVLRECGTVVLFRSSDDAMNVKSTKSQFNDSYSFGISDETSVERKDGKTGTMIRLYGLFHHYAVRRKQLTSKQKTFHGCSEKSLEVAQARSCLSTLSMAYPTVSFKLMIQRFSGVSACTDSVWDVPKDLDRRDESSALLFRLRQHCGNAALKFCIIIPIDYSKDNRMSTVATTRCEESSRRLFYTPGRSCRPLSSGAQTLTEWQMIGILAMPTDSMAIDIQNQTAMGSRNRQHEVIFLNGRQVKQSAYLGDIVQSICKSYNKSTLGEQMSYSFFIIHVKCPSTKIDIVSDEMHSSASIARYKESFETFVKDGLKRSLETYGLVSSDRKKQRIPHGVRHNSRQITPSTYSKNKNVEVSDIRRSSVRRDAFNKSILPSRFITGNTVSNGKGCTVINSLVNKSDTEELQEKSSPFSQAFLNEPAKTNIESSFDLQTQSNFFTAKDFSLKWSRKRLKATDTSDTFDVGINNSSGIPVKMDKSMLSNGTFIAQLDAKFLIVVCQGIMFLVDQHAADERIGLERLEKSLFAAVRHVTHSAKDEVSLSKLARIKWEDLIKSKKLDCDEIIQLTSAQRAIIRANAPLLRKWRFDYDITNSDGDVISLKYVPVFCCRKVATSKDFIEFVDELMSISSPDESIRPTFVKRYLASLACRYAIMFGDVLTEDQCKSILSSLSSCEMPFVCAHGRPSVIPILDFDALPCGKNKMATSSFERMESAPPDEYIPVRFRKSAFFEADVRG